MIESHYIQKLRDLDILRVADMLGMGIRQRRALCPHHDDHHPSLALNVRKQTCHCYSCGFSADNIGLVRERMNLGFAEACRWLADRFDVYIGDGDSRFSARRPSPTTASSRRLSAISELIAREHQVADADIGGKKAVCEPRSQVDVEYYTQVFSQLRLSESGRRFLLEERMISPGVVSACRIVSTERNLCMGRVGRGVFDGPSLLIPYFDQAGKLVSVQSRHLGRGKPQGEEKEPPRFKFAPGSHRMIYGLERLAGYPREEPLLVTEGPSDCWTALSLGLHAVAIPSATLFDRGSKELLEGRNLHIFPDQDEAGLSLYFELKGMFPGLAYHQLPDGCKDLSEYYLRLRRDEGMGLAEAREALMR